MSPLIVGAGPAGCAVALTLQQRGIKARLIERSSIVPDAICGGFMSWRTLDALERLGVTVSGHPLGRVVLFAETRRAESALPGRAMGLSRRTLDTALQAAVERSGGAIERGVEAKRTKATEVRLGDGSMVASPALFLAVGKHDLRGAARPRDDRDPAVGLRIRIAPSRALSALIGDAIELHLFDRAYVGINLQEDGSANVCLAVRKSMLAENGSRPDLLLATLGNNTPLGERLALGTAGTSDAIGAIPYGWRATTTERGVFRVGDQAAVIPSLAGEGIGIAIASGIAAAKAYARNGPRGAQTYQTLLARRTRAPVAIARALWHHSERPTHTKIALPIVRLFPRLLGLAASATRIGD